MSLIGFSVIHLIRIMYIHHIFLNCMCSLFALIKIDNFYCKTLKRGETLDHVNSTYHIIRPESRDDLAKVLSAD